ncbi:MAG: FeoA family protein [Peptococcaceae bacterium]
MPLSMVSYGQEKVILKITGRDHIQKHLANLGFVVGEPVTVISEIGGNMILKVKDVRIALDKTMANRILV